MYLYVSFRWFVILLIYSPCLSSGPDKQIDFPLIWILAFECPVNLASGNSLGSLKNNTFVGRNLSFWYLRYWPDGPPLRTSLNWGSGELPVKWKKDFQLFGLSFFLNLDPIKQLLFSKCFGFWNEDSNLFRLRPLQVYSIDVWFCKTSNEDLFLLKS